MSACAPELSAYTAHTCLPADYKLLVLRAHKLMTPTTHCALCTEQEAT